MASVYRSKRRIREISLTTSPAECTLGETRKRMPQFLSIWGGLAELGCDWKGCRYLTTIWMAECGLLKENGTPYLPVLSSGCSGLSDCPLRPREVEVEFQHVIA